MERESLLLFLCVSLVIVVYPSPCVTKSIEGIDKTNKAETVTYLHGEANLTEFPAYSIQVFSDKDSYDRGDKVSIIAYITGGGDIEESKILGHVPENIISGKVSLTVFKFAQSTIGEWEGWKPVVPPEKFEMSNRFIGDLVKGYFTYQQDKPILWSEGEITYENKSYPPISIAFATKRDAPSGDHKIEFIFKYKSPDGKWSITKETLTIHLRSDIEKYGWILSIIVAIFGIIISIILWLWSRAR